MLHFLPSPATARPARGRGDRARRHPGLPAALSAALTAALVAALGVAGVATAPDARAATLDPGAVADGPYTADALPTVQVDGVVLESAVRGTRVYAVGAFATARPAGAAPGTQLTPRANVLAFDITTGALDTVFDAPTNGRVTDLAVTPDGASVVLAGQFTSVHGQPRNGFAVVDAVTGALRPLNPAIRGTVRSVAVHGTTAYIGGPVEQIQGQWRHGGAAIDLLTGQVTGFAPRFTGGTVGSLVVSPDGRSVVAAGQFTAVNGAEAYGIIRLDAATGASLPTQIGQVIRNGGVNSGISRVAGDDRGFYIAGFSNTVGGFEGSAAADWNGTLRWMEDCHGDTHDIWSAGSTVHVVGHPYSCATMEGFPEDLPRDYRGVVSLLNEPVTTLVQTTMPRYDGWPGQPAPRLMAHFPWIAQGTVTGVGQSAWTVTGTADYLVLGGEFPSVNGVPQQGLVRFGRRGLAPARSGPEAAALAVTATSRVGGEVRVLVTPTWDRDDATLRYRLMRGTTVIDDREFTSSQWAARDFVVIDRGAGIGARPTYTVIATDRDGNSAQASAAPVTVLAAGSATDERPYARAVLADGAVHRWAFDGADLGHDSAGSGPAPPRAGATRAATGVFGAALNLDGSQGAYATSTQQHRAPWVFSVEAWVLASDDGGQIVGFGENSDGFSSGHDRKLYLDDDGRVHFGTWAFIHRVVSAPEPIDDGRWHHLVATVDSDGTNSLYVDGALKARERFPTGALPMTGYWRVGTDATGGWPSTPATSAPRALVDEVAVYHRVLDPAQVARHHELAVAGTTQAVGGASQFRLTSQVGPQITSVFRYGERGDTDVYAGRWRAGAPDSMAYRRGNSFFLRYANTTGTYDREVAFGRAGDVVYVGDFDGDGEDGFAVRRGNRFYIDNDFSGGEADRIMDFGRPDDEVLVGDWDGDGIDTFGVRRGNVMHLRNDFLGGVAEQEFAYGRSGDTVHIGDWDGNGSQTVSVQRGQRFYINNVFRGGEAEYWFDLGTPADTVLVGDWDGNGTDTFALHSAR